VLLYSSKYARAGTDVCPGPHHLSLDSSPERPVPNRAGVGAVVGRTNGEPPIRPTQSTHATHVEALESTLFAQTSNAWRLTMRGHRAAVAGSAAASPEATNIAVDAAAG
jgi:hypothetical protein